MVFVYIFLLKQHIKCNYRETYICKLKIELSFVLFQKPKQILVIEKLDANSYLKTFSFQKTKTILLIFHFVFQFWVWFQFNFCNNGNLYLNVSCDLLCLTFQLINLWLLTWLWSSTSWQKCANFMLFDIT